MSRQEGCRLTPDGETRGAWALGELGELVVCRARVVFFRDWEESEIKWRRGGTERLIRLLKNRKDKLIDLRDKKTERERNDQQLKIQERMTLKERQRRSSNYTATHPNPHTHPQTRGDEYIRKREWENDENKPGRDINPSWFCNCKWMNSLTLQFPISVQQSHGKHSNKQNKMKIMAGH